MPAGERVPLRLSRQEMRGQWPGRGLAAWGRGGCAARRERRGARPGLRERAGPRPGPGTLALSRVRAAPAGRPTLGTRECGRWPAPQPAWLPRPAPPLPLQLYSQTARGFSAAEPARRRRDPGAGLARHLLLEGTFLNNARGWSGYAGQEAVPGFNLPFSIPGGNGVECRFRGIFRSERVQEMPVLPTAGRRGSFLQQSLLGLVSDRPLAGPGGRRCLSPRSPAPENLAHQ
ncbi:PREDICTED: uncharacterized protein LOC106146452 [Chinchilla lanigera]|uniref:uncharacterized protein LOC106146452 n=1 Tax=Chinchilla lanigera TaxID=34839 RepID=UPI000696C6F5|nr:PREDICTED: uncharacterized protein LOC106146452 [Chinchilla lanigera]